jgi:hypothetical protein
LGYPVALGVGVPVTDPFRALIEELEPEPLQFLPIGITLPLGEG